MKNNDPGPNKPGTHSRTNSSVPSTPTATKAQLDAIKNWVTQLNTKKNSKQPQNEVNTIVQQLGQEGHSYLLQCLLESLELSSLSKVAQNSLHNSIKGQYLNSYIHNLIFRTAPFQAMDYLPTTFLKAFAPTNEKLILSTTSDLFKFLKVPLIDQLFVSLAFANSTTSTNYPGINSAALATEGLRLFKEKLTEYSEQSGPHSLPQNICTSLLIETILKHQDLNVHTNPHFHTYKFIKYYSNLKQKQIARSSSTIQEAIANFSESRTDSADQSSESTDQSSQTKSISNNGSAQKPKRSTTPADILLAQGPTSTLTIESIDSAFKEINRWTTSDIYECFELMAEEVNKDQNSQTQELDWNIDIFIEYIQKRVKPTNPEFSWQGLVNEIDRPEMRIRDEKQFRRFWTFISVVNKRFPFQIPYQLIIKRWKNPKSQSQFLKLLISVGAPELIRWTDVPKTIINLEFNQNYKYNSLQPPSSQFFACLEILELLVELSEVPQPSSQSSPPTLPPASISLDEANSSSALSTATGIYSTVLSIFEFGITRSADILIVGLAQVRQKRPIRIIEEIYSMLFPNYLTNHATSIQILEAIWKHNQDLLISAICEVYRKDCKKKENTSLHLSRVLDISQYIKDSLIALTNCTDYAFAVSLGVLSGKREFLHFDQWLNERIRDIGDPFVTAVLSYVEDNIIIPLKEIQSRPTGQNPSNNNNNNQLQQNYEGVLDKAQLTMEIMTIIFESLLVEQSPEKITPKNRQRLGDLYKSIIVFFPMMTGPSDSPSQVTEKKANKIFQRFYSKEINAEELAQTMRTLSTSLNSEDKEVYSCMLSNLIEETRFHDSYPPPELLQTATLYGVIIAQGIAQPIIISILLSKISEAGRISPHRIEFTIRAVETMRDHIHLYPDFIRSLFDLNTLISISHPQFLLSIYQILVDKNIALIVDSKLIEVLKQRLAQVEAQREQQKQVQYFNNPQNPQQQQQQPPIQKQSDSLLPNDPSLLPNQPPQDPNAASQAAQAGAKKVLQKKPLKSLKATSSVQVFDPTNTNDSTLQIQKTYSHNPSNSAILSSSTIPINATSNTTTSNNLSGINGATNPNSLFNTNIPTNFLTGQQSFNPVAQFEDPHMNLSDMLQQHQQQGNSQFNALNHHSTLLQQQQQQQQQQQAQNTGYPNMLPGQRGNQIGDMTAAYQQNPALFEQLQQKQQQQQLQQQVAQQQQQQQQQPQQQLNSESDERIIVNGGRAYLGGVYFQQCELDLQVDVQKYSQSTLLQILQFEDKFQIEDQLKNKVNFNLNNLTESNIDKVSNDIRIFCENDLNASWFAMHIVLRRACYQSESNIAMYIELVHKIHKPSLLNRILIESQLLLHKLLLSELIPTQQERVILKSIAYFIGMLTIRRNKPISAKYLNLKALIVNAYPNRLDLVIPIVSNILRPAAESHIFSPQSNRWIRRILAVLDELCAYTSKETVKIQINHLFSTLQVDPNTLEPCTYFQHLYLESIRNPPIIPQQLPNPQQQIQLQHPHQTQQQQNQQLLQQQQYSQQQQQGQLQQPHQMQLNNNGYMTANMEMNGNLYPNINMQGRMIIPDEFRVRNNINLVSYYEKALEQALSENIPAIVSRSVQIALITTRELCLKDHCTDSNADSLVTSAKNMIQRYAGQLALISCKDPLKLSFSTQLKKSLDPFTEISAEEKEAIVGRIIQENFEIGTAEIKDRAINQALDDLSKDEVILDAIEKRRAIPNNQQYINDFYYQFTKALPPLLYPKFITKGEIEVQLNIQEYKNQVYDKFTQVLIDLREVSDMGLVENFVKKHMLSDEIINRLIEITLVVCMFTENRQVAFLTVDVLAALSTQIPNPTQFSSMLKAKLASFSHRNPFDLKTFPTTFTALFERNLLTLDQLQELLITWISQKDSAIICASKCLNEIIIEKKLVSESEVQNLLFSIKLKIPKQSLQTAAPQEYLKLIEQLAKIQATSNASSYKAAQKHKMNYSTALDVIANLYGCNFDQASYDQAEEKVNEWLPISTHKEISDFMSDLTKIFIASQGEAYSKFFIYFIDICVAHSVESQKRLKNVKWNDFSSEQTTIDLSLVDCFTKLVGIIRKSVVQRDKQHLIDIIYQSIFIVLTKYHETEGEQQFFQRPFYRIFFNMIYDVQRPQYNFMPEDIMETYLALSHLFHKLTPMKYPAFAFAWLELVSNRYFVPLLMEKEECWKSYLKLIIELIRFLREILSEEASTSSPSVEIYYRGIIRVLLILLHDWPDFLARYSNQFCDEIPNDCVQIKNIVLAAFPKSMKPPDPFSQSEQVIENCEDFRLAPDMDLQEFTEKNNELLLSNDLLNYFISKKDEIFQSILRKLMVKSKNQQFVIDQKALNTLVIAIPLSLSALPQKDPKTYMQREESISFLVKLLKVCSYIEREQILQTIINQVRYPNLITKYYFTFFLQIFREQSVSDIHEQATYIIVKRLHARKPHPWGIILTFMEILKLKPSSYKNCEFLQVFSYIQSDQQKQQQQQQQQLSNQQALLARQQQQQQLQQMQLQQQQMQQTHHQNN